MLQATIYIDMEEMIGAKLTHEYIMQFLLKRHVAGATAYKGYAGFGKNQQIKSPENLFSFDEIPMMISFIDEDEKVRDCIKELRKTINSGLITVHSVEQL
jgi:PII-like signaling protein